MDEIDVSKYIGKGYKENSNGPDFYDCYSLFISIQRGLGKNIIDFRHDAKSREERKKAIADGKKDPCFEKIEKPLAGCGVILYYNDVPQHIGVYIGKGKVIHATYDRGVVIDELRTLKVEGFYKVK